MAGHMQLARRINVATPCFRRSGPQRPEAEYLQNVSRHEEAGEYRSGAFRHRNRQGQECRSSS
jgi:hypothetical protein